METEIQHSAQSILYPINFSTSLFKCYCDLDTKVSFWKVHMWKAWFSGSDDWILKSADVVIH